MKPYDPKDYAEIKWADRSWKGIEQCAKQDYVILIPLGSIEQHGQDIFRKIPRALAAFLRKVSEDARE